VTDILYARRLCYSSKWLCWLHGFSNSSTTFAPSPQSHGSYDQMPRRLGAGGVLTVLWFAALVRLHPVPGYNAHWERVPGSCTQRCILANQFQQSLKEENGGGLTSSSFGRLRCRKSPARGFWMCWIHWCHFHSHLKTSSAIFSLLMFQEAPGSLKPYLMEDMVW
jgi:hypothetical protein